MSDVELIREALELLETQDEHAMYLAFVEGDPAGDALAALARVEATLTTREAREKFFYAEGERAAEARVVALTAAIEEERRWVTGTAEHNDARTELYRLAALARTASTTGASGALRDPDPGLGAGSVIDSQPSAKEPAPSTGEVSEPGADREEPSPVGGPAGNRAHGPGSLTSPAPAEPPREEER